LHYKAQLYRTVKVIDNKGYFGLLSGSEQTARCVQQTPRVRASFPGRLDSR